MEQIRLDRLTGLIAFARTASLGSYTSAARTLSISPSAVSKSVQRLEERLGVKLFARTTRSLALTPEGRDLHERVLRLLEDAEAIEQMAAAARAEPSGILKVACPLPLGVYVIAPNLANFRDKYPRITVDLRLSDDLTELVQDGIDVAIRVGRSADSRLIRKSLGPNKVYAFASPDYIRQHGAPNKPEDLSEHDCINVRYHSSGQLMRWKFETGKRTIEILPDSAIIVDNTDAATAAIIGGAGIGLSPAYVAAPHVARGDLVRVLPEYWIDRYEIAALWLESRRGNPKVRAFLLFLEEIFNSLEGK
ncbi:LysR family transcriptional regulator [Dryocola clanedunensis]